MKHPDLFASTDTPFASTDPDPADAPPEDLASTLAYLERLTAPPNQAQRVLANKRKRYGGRGRRKWRRRSGDA